MTISELIDLLEQTRARHGDLEISVLRETFSGAFRTVLGRIEKVVFIEKGKAYLILRKKSPFAGLFGRCAR